MDNAAAAAALKRLMDSSRIQLALAKADGDADSAAWHREMARQAKAEAESQGIIAGKRGTWALSQRSTKTFQAPVGPLFQERSLFDEQ
jgi:hypothetical protein